MTTHHILYTHNKNSITNNKRFKNLLLLISNMSGQPNRYANSAEIFKNKYMDALNLRANVDDFNLQANKNFKKTGTLPPNVKAMVDNRTTTEILADTEKLKLNIIAELKPVMNSSTASVVVQRIQTAPANADGSFLIWTAQNIVEIVKSLKKKYSIGIKGDTKDAENIVSFLSDMYSKIKDYSGTVKTYFDAVGDSKTGLKEGDLDSLRREYEVIVARLKSKFPNYLKQSEVSINNLILDTTRRIQKLYSVLTSNNYKTFIREMQGIDTARSLSSVNGVNDLGKSIFNLLDSLPSVSLIRALYNQLNKSLENKDAIGGDKRNTTLSVKILQEIHDLFPDIKQLEEINRAFETYMPDEISARAPKEGDRKEFPLHDITRFIAEDLQEMNELLSNNFIAITLKESIQDFMDGKGGNNQKLFHEREKALNENESKIQEFKMEYEDILKKFDGVISLLGKLDESSPNYQKVVNVLEMVQNRIDNLKEEYADYLRFINESKLIVGKIRRELLEKVDYLQRITPREEYFQLARDYNPDDPSSPYYRRNTMLNERPVYQAQPEPEPEETYEEEKPQPSSFSSLTGKSELQILIDEGEEFKRLYDEADAKGDTLNKQYYSDLYYANQAKRDAYVANIGKPKGSGLKKKRRGRPKGSGIGPKEFKDKIDHDKGIQPVKKYHPFGKYFVNSHKLNNGNVLSIKSKSGTNIREYPSRTVSPHLGNVIKTIIGGGVPSYNDMEKLSNDEKDYLYKISKRAEFVDKISIPTPSKDQQEKDIHEFEVCKGEIMAGNDSKELIKKFKLLIIKLSKNGTIPKREASEVMTELLELGY